ncbi:uncharacterized protein LOC128259873 [Drosophila gunungcola]|nr:uncharacterized protein LOC128259873 [Drosophila gunungcola]
MLLLPFVMKLFMKNKWRFSLWMLVLMPLMVLLQGEASAAADTTTNATCRHAADMWGDPDPNIFYVCSDGGQPLQIRCPAGRGFFSGLGHLGCLPFAHWPACRPSEEQVATTTAGCDADGHLASPWASPDPNQFYLCSGPNGTPLLLNCAAGKGFVANSEATGCADWSHWRRQMQCEAYY